MRKLNGITINGEYLGNSVVINGMFRAICTISPVIMRDFVLIINKIEELEDAVKIHNFNCGINNIDIEFENAYSKGIASLYFELANGVPELIDYKLSINNKKYNITTNNINTNTIIEDKNLFKEDKSKNLGNTSSNSEIESSDDATKEKNSVPKSSSNDIIKDDKISARQKLLERKQKIEAERKERAIDLTGNRIEKKDLSDDKKINDNDDKNNENKLNKDNELNNEVEKGEENDNNNNNEKPQNVINNEEHSDDINEPNTKQDIKYEVHNSDKDFSNCLEDVANFESANMDTSDPSNDIPTINKNDKPTVQNQDNVIQVSADYANSQIQEQSIVYQNNTTDSFDIQKYANLTDQDIEKLSDKELLEYEKHLNSLLENESNIEDNVNQDMQLAQTPPPPSYYMQDSGINKEFLQELANDLAQSLTEGITNGLASSLSKLENCVFTANQTSSGFNSVELNNYPINSSVPEGMNYINNNSIGTNYNNLPVNNNISQQNYSSQQQIPNSQIYENSGQVYSGTMMQNMSFGNMQAGYYNSMNGMMQNQNASNNNALENIMAELEALKMQTGNKKLATLDEFMAAQKELNEVKEKKRRQKFRIVGSKERISASALDGGVYVAGNKVYKWGDTKVLDE